MDNEKCIVFDVWSDYACFRRGYTTTSILSYPFPSRTTITGFLAGMLGYERDSYYDLFQKDNSKIGLRIINPIKKTHLNLNYINTKIGFILKDIKNNSKRTQIPAEYLKDVKYRFYVQLDDQDVMNKLFNLIQEHKSIYTPYLGISECIANYSLVGNGLYDIELVSGENVDIDSVVLKEDTSIVIEKNKKYGIIKSPGFFNSNREVTGFLEYYYEENGNPIKVKESEYYKIGEDNVILY
ncbi:type I-B CRISPR-associated protein Cas5b [Methanosphaera sp.]|jgi:CRISPR-associated protein Cas5h|uniref:type I-B CRISPR-associated protein Cas5b n=1 Tax=Methanosphaera sp. TaxID=2666342 RepID=UPI003D936747